MSLGEKGECQLALLHLDKGKQMNNSPVGMLEILKIWKRKIKSARYQVGSGGKVHATKPVNNSSSIPGIHVVEKGNTFPKANF